MATKEELLTLLAESEGIDGIVDEPELVETKRNGDKRYIVNVREVFGNAMAYRNVEFYVIEEGAAQERAYFKDRGPGVTLEEAVAAKRAAEAEA